ncbi:TIGR02300 family protein [Rhodovarius crocodyli]|uniref:TIGR02300 family protein n=1 Tax=Rhodovarius crocodyli TaxID=1979269 RepID=A0A437MHM2_9PROT|nr:TIGR02300 family protein [Rhodovarius crocodyli]RVT97154.1 TIGR02300 family protein [Rhodovarius crocodyli]
MAKPELGLKRTCVSCGAKFYDLTKQPAVCPKCGTEQPAEQPRLRRAASQVDEKLKKRPPAGQEAETDDVEIDDVDADDAGLESDDVEDEDEAIEAEIEIEGNRDEEG